MRRSIPCLACMLVAFCLSLAVPAPASAACASGNQDPTLPVKLCVSPGSTVNQVVIQFTVANTSKAPQQVLVTIAVDGKTIVKNVVTLQPGTTQTYRRGITLSPGTHTAVGTAAPATSTVRSSANVTFTIP